MLDGSDKERRLTTSEFVTEHANDPYSMEVATTVGKPESAYSYDGNGVLMRQASIDCALQKVVPMSLPAILYLVYYAVLAEFPGEKKLYDTQQLEFHWPHMVNNA